MHGIVAGMIADELSPAAMMNPWKIQSRKPGQPNGGVEGATPERLVHTLPMVAMRMTRLRGEIVMSKYMYSGTCMRTGEELVIVADLGQNFELTSSPRMWKASSTRSCSSSCGRLDCTFQT
jgi:hypothetical protein